MSTGRDGIPAGRLRGSGPAGTDPAIVRTLARRAHQRKRGRPIVAQVPLGLAGGAPAERMENGSGSSYGAFRVLDKENAGTPLQRSLVTALAAGVGGAAKSGRPRCCTVGSVAAVAPSLLGYCRPPVTLERAYWDTESHDDLLSGKRRGVRERIEWQNIKGE
jgi:hypothetical protein